MFRYCTDGTPAVPHDGVMCVQVMVPQQRGCMMFVPQQIADNNKEILQLLRESFGHSSSDSALEWRECYLLIVGCGLQDSLSQWHGQTVSLTPSAETISMMCEMQVCVHYGVDSAAE